MSIKRRDMVRLNGFFVCAFLGVSLHEMEFMTFGCFDVTGLCFG